MPSVTQVLKILEGALCLGDKIYSLFKKKPKKEEIHPWTHKESQHVQNQINSALIKSRALGRKYK